MPSDLDSFVAACARTGLLIDTNLLILLSVGKKDKTKIASHTRTSCYSIDDYELLLNLIRISNHKLFITPYIIAEVSNLLIDAKRGDAYYGDIAKGIVEIARESHHDKDVLMNVPELSFLGFTDVSIVKTVEDMKCGVVTSDQALFCKLLEKKQNVAHLQTLSALRLGSFQSRR